jgi:hypothetical protein
MKSNSISYKPFSQQRFIFRRYSYLSYLDHELIIQLPTLALKEIGYFYLVNNDIFIFLQKEILTLDINYLMR